MPKRLKWSVMIPYYMGARYVEQAISSVISEAIDAEEMQIAVIDDSESPTEIDEIVTRLGNGRIELYKNNTRLGLVGNWNKCIEKARGEYIHILHQDDEVYTGFYNLLEKGLQSDEEIGAAFCRHALIDADGHWQYLSYLECGDAGILDGWINKIAIQQRIQTPSIVLNKKVYETVGRYDKELEYAADWEMWMRVAAQYKIWFEPRILAGYRFHNAAATANYKSSGKDTFYLRKAIEKSYAYFPKERRDYLNRKARENCATYALNSARESIGRYKDIVGAIRQLEEAFRCRIDVATIFGLIRLVGWVVIMGCQRFGRVVYRKIFDVGKKNEQ